MFNYIDSMHGSSQPKTEGDVDEMHHGVHKNVKLHAEILKQHLIDKRREVEDNVVGDLKEMAVERKDEDIEPVKEDNESGTKREKQSDVLKGQDSEKQITDRQVAVEASNPDNKQGAEENKEGEDGDDDADYGADKSQQIDAAEQTPVKDAPKDYDDGTNSTEQTPVKDSPHEEVKLQQFPPLDLPLARGYSGLPMEKTPALIGAKRGTIECDVNVK